MHHLVLDAAMISGIDASAISAVREVQIGLRSRNIVLEVARATDQLREQFQETGLTELIGEGHFHGTVTAAVEASAGSSTAQPRDQTGEPGAKAPA